jgi:hypothetical protein
MIFPRNIFEVLDFVGKKLKAGQGRGETAEAAIYLQFWVWRLDN